MQSPEVKDYYCYVDIGKIPFQVSVLFKQYFCQDHLLRTYPKIDGHGGPLTLHFAVCFLGNHFNVSGWVGGITITVGGSVPPKARYARYVPRFYISFFLFFFWLFYFIIFLFFFNFFLIFFFWGA